MAVVMALEFMCFQSCKTKDIDSGSLQHAIGIGQSDVIWSKFTAHLSPDRQMARLL